VSDKAAGILEAMRRSQSNWTRHDLETVYTGHGFKIRIGAKHDMAIHIKYRRLRGTLPNHTHFAVGYITNAIKLIDEAKQLEDNEKGIKE
jgi:hypothetical protein